MNACASSREEHASPGSDRRSEAAAPYHESLGGSPLSQDAELADHLREHGFDVEIEPQGEKPIRGFLFATRLTS